MSVTPARWRIPSSGARALAQVRLRRRRLVRRSIAPAVLVFVAALAPASASTADAAVPGTSLKAGVVYPWQPCSSAGARLRVPKPVTAGTLVLHRVGTARRTRVSLVPGGTNPARVSLPGAGRVAATLELVTPRVRVTDAAGRLIRIPLRAQVARNGRATFSVRGADNAGNVNALIAMQRAARVAAVTAPRQLARVTVRIHDAAIPNQAEVFFDAPSTIHVVTEGGAFDPRWEPTPLAHEYGHLILHSLGAEGPAGGDHDFGKSYPESPSLAWNEGFSHAFAAVVLKEGRGLLSIGCAPAFNLAEQPARPGLATERDRRYSQYSETRVAGATYQLIGQLGGGEAGLKRLLGALSTYRRAGHSVWTTRDLRDLVVQAFERSAADQATFDRIFVGQLISWERVVNVGIPMSDPEREKLHQAGDTLTVRVSGPGGLDCRTTTAIEDGTVTTVDGAKLVFGEKRGDGGLAFAGSDDCYLRSGVDTVDFLKPHTFGGDGAVLPFPYMPGLAHWSGEYTVHAKYVCEFQPGSDPNVRYCPTELQVLVTADNLAFHINAPSMAQPFPLSLPRATETVVATFTANGDCRIAAFDCGV